VPDLIFSADSHIVEPPEVWDRVEARYRDRAPRLVTELPGHDLPGEAYVFEQLRPIPVTRFIGAGQMHDKAKWAAFQSHGFDAAPASLRDPAARLVEQDSDGVNGEVIFPTMGMVILAGKDDALKAACFRAVNAYIADYCSVDRNRLVGVGVVSLHDPEQAVKDLAAARELGLRGVLITGSPGEGGFGVAQLDRFWAAAVDMDMPLTLHDLQVQGEVSFTPTERNRLNFFMLPMEVQIGLANMIMGGVFDRHPRLQVVSAENDVGWVPHFVHRLEHFATKIVDPSARIRRLPGEVMRENYWGSTQFENAGLLEAAASVAGAGRIMWGSDYPHPDSTWPNSRDWIARMIAGLSPGLADRVFGQNVVDLYGLDGAALRQRKRAGAAAASPA